MVLTFFGDHNQLIAKVFLNENGRFQWAMLAGVTAVYSFIYSIYLNAHKEKVEIILKPEIKRDQMISDLLSNYLVLSTQLATDINNAIGNQLYRYHEPNVRESSRQLDERIQANYPEFLLNREKLQLEIKASPDSQQILSQVDELHTHVQACLKSYNLCLSKLNKIETERENGHDVPETLETELMQDPERDGIYISRTVRDMFNTGFKPERVNTYSARKRLRTLATEYLDQNRRARQQMFDF